MVVTAAAPTSLGRFELKRMLGSGAQGTVWLAFDPRLEREVAIKQLRVRSADETAVQRWLAEARAVSRLSHPAIVSLFEADVEAQHPFLVFEMVHGQTLTHRLRSKGAMQERDAAELMLEVLEGLVHAHAAGVIHRDLKPSNIMIDEAGRARVMDFGLAVMGEAKESDTGLMGTAAYMAPEAINGAPPWPGMDVFSAGLVFYEMLVGQPAVAEQDTYRTIYRLSHEDIALPEKLPHAITDSLRALVDRALAREPAARYQTAAEFRNVLAQWLAPKEVATESGGRSGTLEFLLRRMQHKSDFPALSESVSRILSLSQSENESIGGLSSKILRDVALTNKLLRLVNSSFYRHRLGGTISTVSRAVALIGFAGIRNIALSLVVMDHMKDKRHAGALREEFLRSIMAGTLAEELCPTAKEAEEAFIGAMFQNMGRMLTQFYFAEEADQIRDMLARASAVATLADTRAAPPPGFDEEERVSRSVLGISFQELGMGVARSWGMPDNLVHAMRRYAAGEEVKSSNDPADRLRVLASAANDVADGLLAGEEDHGHERLQQAGQRYGKALGVESKHLSEAVGRSQSRIRELAKTLAIQVKPGSPTATLVGQVSSAEEVETPRGRRVASGEGPGAMELDAAVRKTSAAAPEAVPPAALAPSAPVVSSAAAETLAAGIQDISNSLVENFKLNEVLRMVLETLLRSLDFQRVVFCLRDSRTGLLTGRLALGLESDVVAKRFQVKLTGQADLFAAVCLRGADMLITDASAPNIAARLPPWFVQGVNAPTFLLLPLVMKNSPIGLIYADKSEAGAIVISERELSLLRTLRNQAVMAFKHASS